MVMLPAGSFLMGTAEADRLIDPRTGKPATNDGPRHEVRIDSPFAIGKYEVTVGEYAAFVDATGHESRGGCMEFSPPTSFTISENYGWDRPGFPQGDDHPVGCVSRYDAEAYAAWLGELTGEDYRLPSEAEWEYAARAGATGPFFWGDDIAASCEHANVRSPGAQVISRRQAAADLGGFPCDDGEAHSSPAGRYRPNAFGLHDVQGNVWEWVADCSHKNYEGAPADGRAWIDERDAEQGCQFGVIRGGSFLNLVERSSVTVRAGRPQAGRATNMGFRVARGGGTRATGETARAWEFESGTGSEGARLFADNCAACHLESDSYRGLYGRDQQSVEDAIRGGGNNVMSMPAFGDVLTDAEISTLARYLRRRNGWE